MNRRHDHLADPHLAPFALWNPLAMEGVAEAFGSMLRSTSVLVMLATSRTPAQWITGQRGRALPASIAGECGPTRTPVSRHGRR